MGFGQGAGRRGWKNKAQGKVSFDEGAPWQERKRWRFEAHDKGKMRSGH